MPDVLVNGTVIRLMDETGRAKSIQEDNCEPACHACHKKIGVGDAYGLHGVLTSEEAQVALGSPEAIRGMYCVRCVRENRKLSKAERKRLVRRFRDAESRAAPPAPKSKPEPAPWRGSFARSDGTTF